MKALKKPKEFLRERIGTRLLALKLTVLAAITEDLDSGPSAYTSGASSHIEWSVTPVPRDVALSSSLCWHQAHMWCQDKHAGKTLIHIK